MEDAKALGIYGVTFNNWAQTFTCSPELYFAPKSQNELRQILAFARHDSKKVRVVGSGHSPSDLVCCQDYIISLQHLDKIQVDFMNCLVKVEGGVKVETLNEELPKHHLALSVLGSVSGITLAGAISTGTHGSGINFGNMCSYVTELEIMKSTGEIVCCSRTENPEIFLASICGIGATGIIVSIKYKCEPRFNLHRHQYPLKIKEIIEHLDVHLTASDHFHFHWYPHTDNVLVIHQTRTTKPVTRYTVWKQWSNWFWNYAVGYYGLEFGYWLGTFFPGLVGVINRFMFTSLCSETKELVDEGHKVMSMECRFKQYVSEWAIDISKTGEALLSIKEWLESNPDVYAHFAVEIRFSKEDDFYISPCYGQNTCYINIVMYRPYNKPVPIEKYWNAFESIMGSFGGRPHWAKAHKLNSKDLKAIYPKWDEWCDIRAKMDPTNMFVNSYLERILN